MEKILLFIPMYNCRNQITRVLDQINGENEKYISEIIIVNNRSTDNGGEIVKEYLTKRNFECKVSLLLNDENYGLGGSHKVAFNYAVKNNFDYIIVLHGDDQGDFNNIVPILKNKEYKKYDCMLGSRIMRGSKLKGYSKFRTFGNKVYNLIFSKALFNKIYDLGSGLNMYSIKMLESGFYNKFSDGLTFNCYMLLASNYYKHNIRFFPITWREDDQVSNVKMMSQALNTFGLVVKYFFERGKYIKSDLRDKRFENYTSTIEYRNKE